MAIKRGSDYIVVFPIIEYLQFLKRTFLLQMTKSVKKWQKQRVFWFHRLFRAHAIEDSSSSLSYSISLVN